MPRRWSPRPSDDIPDIDEAMRLGYNWQWGPFELSTSWARDGSPSGSNKTGLPVPALLRAAEDKSFYRV